MKTIFTLISLFAFVLPLFADPKGLDELELQKAIEGHLEAINSSSKPNAVVYASAHLFNLTAKLADNPRTQLCVEKGFVIPELDEAGLLSLQQYGRIDSAIHCLDGYVSLLEKRVSGMHGDIDSYGSFSDAHRDIRNRRDNLNALIWIYKSAHRISDTGIKKVVASLKSLPMPVGTEDATKRNGEVKEAFTSSHFTTEDTTFLVHKIHKETESVLKQCTHLTTRLNERIQLLENAKRQSAPEK